MKINNDMSHKLYTGNLEKYCLFLQSWLQEERVIFPVIKCTCTGAW